MNERKDERWLDDQLRRVINAGRPEFDAESWKRKHRAEYETLMARRESSVRSGKRLVLGRWTVGLAVAATIILAAGLLLLGPVVREPQGPAMPSQRMVNSTPEMMSMKSLRMAYERGGFDALDRQLQNALDEFGPRSSSVSLQELF